MTRSAVVSIEHVFGRPSPMTQAPATLIDVSDLPLNNPAARLAAFFETLSEAWNSTDNGNDAERNKRILARALNLESLESAQVATRWGALMGQVQQIDRMIALKKVSPLYAEMIPELNRFLDSMGGAFSNTGFSNPQPLLALVVKLCAEELASTAPEDVPAESDLLQVRADLNKLLEEVLGAGFNDDLKLYLSGELHKLLDGIDTFQISGVAPVRTAVFDVWATLQTSFPEEAPEEAVDVTSRLVTVLQRLGQLINIGGSGAAIAGVVMQAIGTGAIPHH